MTAPYVPQIALYRQWLADKRGLKFSSFEEMRQWSVRDIDAYWQSIWDYFELQSPTPHSAVLAQRKMPDAVWFPGAHGQLCAAGAAPCGGGRCGRHAGHHQRRRRWRADAKRAGRSCGARSPRSRIHLKAQGVGSGDRVAAYLPNIPETIVAFLATASIGAIWSVCAPDMAAPAVIDRFKQIEPKVLIACDAVTYAGKRHDRNERDRRTAARTADRRSTVILHGERRCRRRSPCSRTSSSATGSEIDAFEPVWLPFDHPLWIVYSSGTTGLPKPIVHGHGGIIIVALPLNVLHNDIGCSYAAKFAWRALSLVQLDRLDHVELPGRRPARRHHHLHFRRQPRRLEGQAGLDHAVALRG